MILKHALYILMILALGLAVAPRAHADEPPGEPGAPAPSGGPREPGEPTASGEPSDPSAPSAPEEAAPTPAIEEARAHHRRGLALYDEGDYRLALIEFQRAYAVGKSYKTLFNVGQVHFQLSQYAKARLALEQYLTEGGAAISPKRRAEVDKDLAALRTRTATLTVRANVAGADVTINDAPAGKAPLEAVLVDAGVLRVRVAHPGYVSSVRDVTLAGGDVQTLAIGMPSESPRALAPPASSGLPREAVAAWIVTGVLTAGAITTGIITTVSASNYESKRQTAIPGTPAEARAELLDQRADVKTLAVATDVVGIGAVVAGVVSLYLTFRSAPGRSGPQVGAQGSRTTLSIGF
jgi:hypothetical protein